MPRFCACILCAIAAAVVAALLLASPSEATAAEPVSFLADVAPILKENCFACHDAKKKAGKYDMTTVEKLFAGGSAGEPIVAGKPKESDFYDLIVTHEERRMPPRDKGDAVPKDQAAVVERWIAQGAKLDAGLDPKADLVKELRSRWQPPTPPAVYPFPAIVNALAFSPDGKRLVVGGYHELTVWNLDPTPNLVSRVHTRAERAYGIAFLADGTLAVAGGRPGQEGDVRIYDLRAKPAKIDGAVGILDGVRDPKVMLKQLLDSDDAVLCLAVSPDGKTLTAGGCDRTARVWDVSAGAAKAKHLHTVEQHSDWVLGVALPADGKHLFTASRDKTAKAWDLAAKETTTTFAEHNGAVLGVASSADGKLGYSVGSDRQVRSWKLDADGRQHKNAGGHTDDVTRVVLNPKGQWLATASADKTVRLWDVKDANALGGGKSLVGLNDVAYAVAFSPDGSHVAAGSYDGEIRLWTAADGKLVAGFNASPGQPTSFSLPPVPKTKK